MKAIINWFKNLFKFKKSQDIKEWENDILGELDNG